MWIVGQLRHVALHPVDQPKDRINGERPAIAVGLVNRRFRLMKEFLCPMQGENTTLTLEGMDLPSDLSDQLTGIIR